jgi:hypothetical protein
VIARYYAKYVERIAADRGVLAFFKWWVAGFALQILLLIPALPLLVVASVLRQDAGGSVAVFGFLTAFVAARVCLFVVPCARVARVKGLGAPWAWGAGGLLVGQWILAVAASLPPRTPPAAAPALPS